MRGLVINGLDGNQTTVYLYDNVGKAYKETRTYARGYQITGASFSETGAGVAVVMAGAYTYDTNNNLTGTMKADATRTGSKLSYRAQWTFAFDRKNRLSTHLNVSSGNHVRGNLWYDSQGRVWQRWNYNTGTSQWDGTVTRYVYNGGALVQEHEFAVSQIITSWLYTYDELKQDYLRQPAGMRQRERSSGTDTDYFMQSNQSSIEYKTERDPVSATIARSERNASLDQLPGGTFQNISHLATSGAFIESYGDSTNGYEPLMQFSDRHALPGVGRWLTLRGNNGQVLPPWPREYYCNCEDCKRYLTDTCDDFISKESTLRKICGCEEGIYGCCITQDPCLGEGKDYSCREMVCGSEGHPPTCGDPCNPSQWPPCRVIGSGNLAGNGGGGTEPIGREVDPGFTPDIRSLNKVIGDIAEGELCFCACFVASNSPDPAQKSLEALAACALAKSLANRVRARYGGHEGTQIDAMRHCVLSCLLHSNTTTSICADAILEIHEFVSRNDQRNADMDRSNNEQGRDCAGRLSEFGSCQACCYRKLVLGILDWHVDIKSYQWPGLPEPDPPASPEPAPPTQPMPWDPIDPTKPFV